MPKRINTYATELSHIAYTTLHNEEILKDVNKCIELYKDRADTKQQVVNVYKNTTSQTKLELKIKQKKIESDYYLDI